MKTASRTRSARSSERSMTTSLQSRPQSKRPTAAVGGRMARINETSRARRRRRRLLADKKRAVATTRLTCKAALATNTSDEPTASLHRDFQPASSEKVEISKFIGDFRLASRIVVVCSSSFACCFQLCFAPRIAFLNSWSCACGLKLA